MAKRSGQKRRQPRAITQADARKVDEIGDMLDSGYLETATQEIWTLISKRPNMVESWELLLEMGIKTNDNRLIWYASRDLSKLEPHEESHRSNLVFASTRLVMVHSTLYHATLYLERFPHGEQNEEMRQLLDSIQPAIEDNLKNNPMAQDAELADLVLFEEGQMLVSMGMSKEGRVLSQEAAKRLKYKAPPLNNVSMTYALEGNLERALSITEKVLAEYPDNFHARCSEGQYLVRLGRENEAALKIGELRREDLSEPDQYNKLIETFAYAGYDEALIEIYERAEKLFGKEIDIYLDPMSRHQCGVAYARCDNEKQARKIWKAVLRNDPHFSHSRDNLADLRMPPGEQIGAWYFTLNYWLARNWLERLLRAFSKGGRQQDPEESIRVAVEKLVNQLPALKAVLPILLDRGDGEGIDFVLNIAKYVNTPGLADFAMGQRGTDTQRMEAGQLATQYGQIDRSQPVTLTIKGQPREIMMMAYELHGEPEKPDLPDEALEYYQASVDAVYNDEPEEALEWVEQALTIAPDARQLLNQRGLALQLSDRQEEADAVWRDLAERYPDYFYARCAMAKMLGKQKKYDEAQEWLAPLFKRERLHFAEYALLATTQIELFLAQKKMEEALSWIAMWADIDPESVPDVWLDLLDR
ncbi:MAG: hypothetical protein JXJ17_05980 [Anaerolineae bacterium]|nr:hypothetical protein [Anaerolineae bacterium]